MFLSFRSSTRTLASVAAAILLGSSLAACGGGSTSSVVPSQALPQSNAPVTDASATRTLSVDKAGASSIMSIVKNAKAYASPVQGKSIKRLALRTTATSSIMDLSYYGGPTVSSLKQYDILVNCAASCWGSPGTFQSNFGNSTMVHILDQYTNSTVNNRYTFAGYLSTTYNTSGTLSDQDVYNIVHAAAVQYGTGGGYGIEYHVFFAQGVNQCSQSAGGCYSPSNPSQWTYCAYHGYTTFSDVGHVLYSVEPYQNVNGCQVNGGTVPNGYLVDSTSSTLSHELSETITDPDVPDNVAWYNNYYGEIGDECAPANGYATGNVTLNGHVYDIQKEYSNYSHACKFSK